MNLTHFSLFSGIGGIDLAAEWAGFKTVGQCEYADYPYKVLEKNFPNVEKWRDVRYVTAESIRERGIKEITLLSGGFPCQPHSLAGKRKASADERDLWGEYARIIGEVRPKWVLGENVTGLLTSENGRFFGRILRDLDGMGYNVGWCVYGAHRVGAIHRRERIFIIANTNSSRVHKCEEIGRGNGDIYRQNRETKKKTSKWECFNGIRENGSNELMASSLGLYRSNWGIESRVDRVNNGVSNGMDRIKCLGNAVVPQQVYPILKAIADIENSCIRGD